MNSWVLYIPEVAKANGWCMKTSCFQCLTYPYFDDYLRTIIFEHAKFGKMSRILGRDFSRLKDKEKLFVCYTVCKELHKISWQEIDMIDPYPLRNIFMLLSELFDGNNEPIKIMLGECYAKHYLLNMENHYNKLNSRRDELNHQNNKYTNAAKKILKNPKIPDAWLKTDGVISQVVANDKTSKSGLTNFSDGKKLCSNCEEYRLLCEFKNFDAVNGYQMNCLFCKPLQKEKFKMNYRKRTDLYGNTKE